MKSSLVTHLENTFDVHKCVARAAKQSAYMRNQFVFLGISKPLRALIEKDAFKKYPIENESELISHLTDLWNKEHREFQYAAMQLAVKYRKLWSLEIFHTFEFMIRTKSWWDTVDTVASTLVGPLVLRYPELIPAVDHWIQDPYLWIRRSAIIFQLTWKHKTDQVRLFANCTQSMHECDFFMRKAIGWALRQYSKTNPEAVKEFLMKNRHELSALSIREARKYLHLSF